MTARIALWILAVLWLLGGIWGDMVAKSAIHQVLAQMDYLIAAVFIIGAEIVGAIAKGHPADAQSPENVRAVVIK